MKKFLIIVGVIGIFLGYKLWKDAEQDFVSNTGVSCSNYSSRVDCLVLRVEQREREQSAAVWIMAIGGMLALVSTASYLKSDHNK